MYVASSKIAAKKLAEEDGWHGELLQETDVLDTMVFLCTCSIFYFNG